MPRTTKTLVFETTRFAIGDRVELLTNLTAMGGTYRAHVNFGEVVNISAHRVHVRNEHGNLAQYRMDGTATRTDHLSPQRIERVIDLDGLKGMLAELMNQHAHAADMDAGFDAGEFSGPAHGDMLEKAIASFQFLHRLSDDQMSRLLNED